MAGLWKNRCWWQKILISIAVLAVAGSVWLWFWLMPNGLAFSGDIGAYTLERKGEPIETQSPQPSETAGASVYRYATLTSSSGLEVPILIRRPDPLPAAPMPLVMLIGGFNSGREAVRLIEDPADTLLVGISYPYEGEGELDGLAYFAALRDLRRALHDTPAALMLTLDVLTGEFAIDPQRVELVGVSLGSFLVCVTGALDDRFTRIWSVHGGAGFPMIFEAALKDNIPLPIIRKPLVHFGNFLVQRLDPDNYAGRISPRPLVMINADKDEAIPREAAERLYASAADPKELIWLDTGHVHPSRKDMIRNLVSLVLDRVAAGS